MLAELKPYPEYVASNIPGVNAVPAHWRAARIKTALRELDRRSRDGSGTLLSLTRVRGLIRQSEMTSKATTAATLEGYKLYRPGEIVMNRMQAWSGMFGTGPEAGLVSPDYAVFRVLDGNDSAFLVHLLRSPAMVAQFAVESKGIGSGFNRLYTDKFGAIAMPLPPPAEQAGIVRFLGAVDRKVNRFIRAKRRLIEVLTEQKQAIITHAVTKGLNPHAPRKPSGMDWEIPAHWEVSRVKTEMHCLNSRRIPLSGTERGKMTLRLYDYYGASGVIDKVDEYLFDDDLLLIAEDGANLVLRNLPLAIIARGKFWVNNHAHILKPKRGCLEYFAAVLESMDFTPWITGAAQPKLTQDRLMAVRIPAPPVAEQNEIMAAVADQTRGLSEAINRVKREIDLIREYRTRLVADVVTGKLDVRGVVPAEPMPADEPADEPIEEISLEDQEAELVEEAVDAAD